MTKKHLTLVLIFFLFACTFTYAPELHRREYKYELAVLQVPEYFWTTFLVDAQAPITTPELASMYVASVRIAEDVFSLPTPDLIILAAGILLSGSGEHAKDPLILYDPFNSLKWEARCKIEHLGINPMEFSDTVRLMYAEFLVEQDSEMGWNQLFQRLKAEKPLPGLSEIMIRKLTKGIDERIQKGFEAALWDAYYEPFEAMERLVKFNEILIESDISLRICVDPRHVDSTRVAMAADYVKGALADYFVTKNPIHIHPYTVASTEHPIQTGYVQRSFFELLDYAERVLQLTSAEIEMLELNILKGERDYKLVEDIIGTEIKEFIKENEGRGINVFMIFDEARFERESNLRLAERRLSVNLPSQEVVEIVYKRYVDLVIEAILFPEDPSIKVDAKKYADMLAERIKTRFAITMKTIFPVVFDSPRARDALLLLNTSLAEKEVKLADLMQKEVPSMWGADRIAGKVLGNDFQARSSRAARPGHENTKKREQLLRIAQHGTERERDAARETLREFDARHAKVRLWTRLTKLWKR